MFRLIGLLAVIPVTMLLTVSFFVLFAVRKQEARGLKAFGYVIAALLWISAFLVFSVGVYTLSTGRHPMMSMMQEMMCSPMHEMMEGKMPMMMQWHKQKMMKDKSPSMMQGQTQEPMTK